MEGSSSTAGISVRFRVMGSPSSIIRGLDLAFGFDRGVCSDPVEETGSPRVVREEEREEEVEAIELLYSSSSRAFSFT